jgi:hypothetical protein
LTAQHPLGAPLADPAYTRLPGLIGRASVAALIAAGIQFRGGGAEIVAIGADLVNEVGAPAWAERISRTDRLMAARTLIVITVYFEELAASSTGSVSHVR